MERAFLEAIGQTPDDDTPRLILADWLEENGDPDRAEFIRDQCQLAHLDNHDARCKKLRERTDELLAKNPFWKTEAAPQHFSEKVIFERGLAERLAITTQEIREDSKVLLKLSETIRKMEVTLFLDEECRELSTSPYLNHITHIKTGCVADSEIISLLRSEKLANLQGIDLSEGQFHDAVMDAITRNPYLRKLQSLMMGDNPLTDAAMTALAASTQLTSVRMLDLRDLAITSQGALALSQAPVLAAVGSLNLSNNKLGDAGIEAFARSSHLGHLEKMNLSYTKMSAEGVKALLVAPWMTSLRQMSLEGNRFGDKGASLIANHPGQWNVTDLKLSLTDISDEGVEELALSGKLATLTSLELYSNDDIFDDGALALAKANAPLLTYLNVKYTSIGYAGLKALLDSKSLGLRCLVIGQGLIAPEQHEELQRMAEKRKILLA